MTVSGMMLKADTGSTTTNAHSYEFAEPREDQDYSLCYHAARRSRNDGSLETGPSGNNWVGCCQ